LSDILMEATGSGLDLQLRVPADDDPDAGDAWIFRYDDLRERRAGEPHPPTHLQINRNLNVQGVLPAIRPLSRLHFPTGRMPLEGVIRLLIEEFGVECALPRGLTKT